MIEPADRDDRGHGSLLAVHVRDLTDDLATSSDREHQFMTIGLNLGDLHQTRREGEYVTVRFTLPDKRLTDTVLPRGSVNEECMPGLWGNPGAKAISFHASM
jgi:hypothetical protein